MAGRSIVKGEAKPFVKWVGGKGQLIPDIKALMPAQFNKYFEPFLGGGALFFSVKPKIAFLNDINSVLIGAFSDIQSDPRKLIHQLEELHKSFHELKPSARREFYNNIRSRYNDLRLGDTEKTAYLIFLNRTCFNGLYRENSSGGFNVPFGDNKNPKICDDITLLADSVALKSATLTSLPFEIAVKDAGKNDFVYFDPPYYPVSETSKFTKYHGADFLADEQRKLKETFVELSQRGCKVMMSNSYTPFIIDLYKEFRQETVAANRAINSKGALRGKIRELIVLNY